MTMPKTTKEIRFEGPATYRITVQGVVNQKWSDRLGELKISDVRGIDLSVQTTMVGPVRDQAQLSGVLDTLYNLHLTILKVERVQN